VLGEKDSLLGTPLGSTYRVRMKIRRLSGPHEGDPAEEEDEEDWVTEGTPEGQPLPFYDPTVSPLAPDRDRRLWCSLLVLTARSGRDRRLGQARSPQC